MKIIVVNKEEKIQCSRKLNNAIICTRVHIYMHFSEIFAAFFNL